MQNAEKDIDPKEIDKELQEGEEQETADPDVIVNRAQARKEVENWLTAKRVSKGKRKQNADAIKAIESAIMYGNLSIDPNTNIITQKLTWPLCDDKGNEMLLSLTYKPRLTVGELQDRIKGVGGNAGSDVINATLSALTSQGTLLLKKMDTEDYSTAQSVAVFFL